VLAKRLASRGRGTISVAEEGARAIRVQVSEPALLNDLLAYLRDCGCVAEQAGASEAEVSLPGALGEGEARMEVGVYLTAWTIRHEGVSADIID
jgi:hypothetical protein